MSLSDSDYSNYFQPDQLSNAQDESPFKVPSPTQYLNKNTQNSHFLSSGKKKQRNNMYQLTFKKQNLQQIFKNQRDDNGKCQNLVKNLFTQPSSEIKKMLQIPIEEFYNSSLQHLKQQLIPENLTQNKTFAKNLFVSLTLDDKLSQKERFKMHLIRRIYQLKIIMSKYRNSKANLQSLTSKQSKSQQQIYKELVLTSLVGQLKKKVFLEGLKFNYYQRKYFNLHLTKPEKKDQDSLEQQRQYSEQEKERIQSNEKTFKEDPRAVILTHVLRTLTQSRLYFSLKILQMLKSKEQPKINQQQSSLRDDYQINQDDTSNLIMDESENQFFTHNQKEEFRISPSVSKQQKMAQLSEAIGEIQFQIKNALQTQKGSKLTMILAFNRWKIFCYTRIMEYIAQHNIPSNYQGYQKQQNQQSFQEYIKQKTNQLQDDYYEQRSENENSLNQESQKQTQIDAQQVYALQKSQKSLKYQKKQLKTKIFQLRARQFLQELQQFQSYKRIKYIVQNVRNQKLVKKTFQALMNNSQNKRREVQLQQYSDYISEQQNQCMLASVLFHNTNMLARTFFHLKSYKNSSRMFKAIENLVKRSFFQKIYQVHAHQRRQQNQFERYKQLYLKSLMFKAFSILKDKVVAPKKALKIYQQYKKQKRQQIIGICFSALNLEVKKNRLLKRKAEKYYTRNILTKFFQKIKVFCQKGLVRTKKSEVLFQTFNHIQKVKTLKKIRQFYDEQLIFQDLEVQTHRLTQIILQRRTRKCLIEWRKGVIQKNTYQVIQVRLARLTQKQKIRKIFSYWYEQAGNMRHLKTQTKSSVQHKDWLKKYYNGLCQIDS